MSRSLSKDSKARSENPDKNTAPTDNARSKKKPSLKFIEEDPNEWKPGENKSIVVETTSSKDMRINYASNGNHGSAYLPTKPGSYTQLHINQINQKKLSAQNLDKLQPEHASVTHPAKHNALDVPKTDTAPR